MKALILICLLTSAAGASAEGSTTDETTLRDPWEVGVSAPAQRDDLSAVVQRRVEQLRAAHPIPSVRQQDSVDPDCVTSSVQAGEDLDSSLAGCE